MNERLAELRVVVERVEARLLPPDRGARYVPVADDRPAEPLPVANIEPAADERERNSNGEEMPCLEQISPLTAEEKKKVWLELNDMSEKEFDEMLAANRARAVRAPKLGEPAPDFELERLGLRGERTGEFVSLAGLAGKPVALAFDLIVVRAIGRGVGKNSGWRRRAVSRNVVLE